jgi:hypothetical protein
MARPKPEFSYVVKGNQKIELPAGTRYVKQMGGKHVYYHPGRNVYFVIYRVLGGWRVDQYAPGCEICA